MLKIRCLTVGLLEANCYLLISQGESLIIDPGAEGDKILAEIKKSKTKLKYIINTHYHSDHVGANEFIKQNTQAKILIHRQEKEFINFSVDRFLEQGDEIKIGNLILKVLHTPGHSKGSICLLEKDFIFTGDTLFQFGYGRVDLPGGLLQDIEQSLQKLSQFLNKGMKIYPGHGDSWIVK